MYVCATLGSTVTRLREKNKLSKEKSLKVVIFHVRVATPLFCTFVKVTNVINRAIFSARVLRGLISASGRF
jgi:hypothetical protein